MTNLTFNSNSILHWILLFLLIFLNLFLIVRHYRSKSEEGGELFARILGANFFALYLLYRINLQWINVTVYGRFPSLFGWIQWILIVFPFVIFLFSYLFRGPAKSLANKWNEIVFPLFVAAMPFGVYESNKLIYDMWVRKTPFLYSIFKTFYPFSYLYFDWVASLLIFLGDVIALWALLYLRRSFSIMTEVRELQVRGPYRWIRHPMYLGEILATIGFCLLKFSWFNIGLTCLFIFLLTLRAKIEENKILKYYPEYIDYQKQTGCLFPALKIW